MFGKIFAMVTAFFGVASLPKDSEGKSMLTAEMEAQMTEKWGAKFVESFKADLAKEEANGGDPSKYADVVKLQADLAELKNKFEAATSSNANLEKEKEALNAKIAKLGQSAEEDGAEIIDMGTGAKKSRKFKADMSFMHNKVIDNYFNGDSSMMYSTDETIDTSQLQTEFGKYISSDKIEILRKLTTDLTCTEYMTTVVTDKTEYRATQSHVSNVLQQFTPYWTPSGKVRFTPITIKNYFLKVNVPIKPADIIDQYIGKLYDEKLTPEAMPIAQYIVDFLVLPQLMEDLENAMAIGEFDEFAPTDDGEAAPTTAAIDSMDGYVTTLKKLKALPGNKVNWLLNGVVLTETNIIEEMGKAVDSVALNYKRKKMFIHADSDLITMYQRAYLEIYKNRITADDVKLKLDFSNFTFAELDGMIGTGAFFITPKENFKHLMSKNPRDSKIYMQVQNYDVKVFMEFRKGCGFAMHEALFAYLPDSVAGGASIPLDGEDEEDDGI